MDKVATSERFGLRSAAAGTKIKSEFGWAARDPDRHPPSTHLDPFQEGRSLLDS